jgi:hypothetical protein
LPESLLKQFRQNSEVSDASTSSSKAPIISQVSETTTIVVEKTREIKEENKLDEVWEEFNHVFTTEETRVTMSQPIYKQNKLQSTERQSRFQKLQGQPRLLLRLPKGYYS